MAGWRSEFPASRWWWISVENREGRQIYFHEEALVDLEYDDLEVGDEVRYAAAQGDEGLQASTVARLDPQDIGPTQEKDVPVS